MKLSNPATVTMTIQDFRQIEADYAALERKLQEVSARGHSTRPANVQHATAVVALQAALQCVSYAVANLPPELHAGWPTAALHVLADALTTLADDTGDGELRGTAVAFREFASDAADVEAFRDRRYNAAKSLLDDPAGDKVTGSVQLDSENDG